MSSHSPGTAVGIDGRTAIAPTVARLRSSCRRPDGEHEPCAGDERVAARGHREAAALDGLAADAHGVAPTPAVPVTTPTGNPSRSSTGPCSMWSSR